MPFKLKGIFYAYILKIATPPIMVVVKTLITKVK